MPHSTRPSRVDYSNLFHSGLRSIGLQPRTVAFQRQRSASVSNSRPVQSDSVNGDQKKRSSLLSFSSRFLKRGTHDENDDDVPQPSTSRPFSSMTVKRGRVAYSEDKDGDIMNIIDIMPLTSSASSPQAGPLDLREPCVGKHESIDPFSSSPGTKSFMVSLSELPSTPKESSITTKRAKYESFLSFSTTHDSCSDRPPRRSRPTSVQTIPPDSKRSSGLYLISNDSEEDRQPLHELGHLSLLSKQLVRGEAARPRTPHDDWHQFDMGLAESDELDGVP